jgi:hypothetical protein
VSEKTLDTAMKYVKLLWGERANENLIKSINPLAEVEVNFGHGDVRHLEFDFHRVKGDRGVRQVLVSVSDVTSRVLLSRELGQSEHNSAMQMDVLLGILKIDREQLVSFLADSEAELNQINAVLKVPVREEAKFRQKVDELFHEMHKLKGEAAALASIRSRRARTRSRTCSRSCASGPAHRRRFPAARGPARRPVCAPEIVA